MTERRLSLLVLLFLALPSAGYGAANWREALRPLPSTGQTYASMDSDRASTHWRRDPRGGTRIPRPKPQPDTGTILIARGRWCEPQRGQIWEW